MATPQSIFITGANRGLGLEMVKQILTKIKPQFLFATFRERSRAEELHQLASLHSNLHLIQLDMANERDFEAVGEKVYEVTKGAGLNLLVNNAGVYSDDGQSLQDVSKDMLMHYFHINTVSPLLLVRALLNQLEKGAEKSSAPFGAGKALVVNISSAFASITKNSEGGYFASRPTRTASNAITKNLSVELVRKGVVAIAMSPGWVQTDQGGPLAPLKPSQSVEGMLNVIRGLRKDDNGKFYQYDGKELPW